uniref:Uncharacterized protein n=1 Tax=Nelumbo nucifera TaxID=4432 RepID=A0A822ZW81_NELNU|nr:TPA_asm: hypothetical protein HUJ06_017728 [Nelumbo nucifera]
MHIVVLTKLNLLAGGHGTNTTMVTAFVWPFILKLPFTRYVGRGYTDLVATFTFFFFRLRLIVFGGDSNTASNDRRWERALRLFYRRATETRTVQSDKENLHALSMFSL